MRRRDLIGAGFGAAAALVVGTGRADAAPRSLDPGAAAARALYQAGGEPLTLPALTLGLRAARTDFRAAHYAALGATLPGLVAGARAIVESSRGLALERAQAGLAHAYMLTSELATKFHDGAAWPAADRALTAARESGDPVVVGEAARILAITMRRAGRTQAAMNILTSTAAENAAGKGAAASVHASLLMTAAYTAATGGQRSDALRLMDEVEDALSAGGRPVGTLFAVEPSRVQADVYWIGVHNALGTPDEGVRYAARVDPVALPTAERRARAATDTARMWHALGDQQRTFAALRTVEQAAPEEVRRPALRALTADLLYGPRELPGLREFARRTGALAGA